MPNFVSYWSGHDQAVVTDDQVKCWRSTLRYHIEGGIRNEYIGYLNKGFEIFYTARTNLKECTDSKRRESMQKELEECANAGWGVFSVGSLKQALESFAKHGTWTDDHVSFYHKKDWSLYKVYWNNGATAAVNFMEAFDSKNQEAVEAFGKFKGQTEKLKELSDKGHDLTEREAKSAAEILKEFKEGCEKAEKILWWTSQATDLAEVAHVSGTLEEFVKTVEKCHRYAETFTKGLGKGLSTIDDAVRGYETYRAATDAGLPEGAAATIALLEKAMEFVPVFGKLYGTVLGGIPATTELIQSRANELKTSMQRLGLE